MIPLAALLVPILLSSVLVFVLSFLVHMVLKYHASDYTPLPNEDAFRSLVRQSGAAPKQYVFPYAGSPEEMKSESFQKKCAEGPNGVLTLKPAGEVGMGKALGMWFVFTLVVSTMVAYVSSAALPRGTDYLKVFQVAGTVAWLAYAFGQLPSAIWMGKPWSIAAKEVFDGLLYGMVTAGAFGWLWPR